MVSSPRAFVADFLETSIKSSHPYGIFRAILLFSCGCIYSGYAQDSDLRGLVSDSTTGERLPFANVVIRGTHFGAATNTNGFYLIPSVPPGEYEIVASYLGYQTQTIKIQIGASNVLTVNFSLKESIFETEEVVVTGCLPSRFGEIATSFHTLSQAQIKRVPVPAQEDLFRSLQVLPSFVSTGDVSSRFYVRGGAGDQNLILLDGMKIYNPYHAFGVFSSFDPDLIRTVEIYTGAFPAGYGGRLSSVIDIKTRTGRSDRVGAKASANFLSANAGIEGLTFLGGNITWLGSVRKSLFNQTLTTFLNQTTPLSFYDAYVKLSFPGEEESFMNLQAFFSGDDVRDFDPERPDYRWRNSAFSVNLSGLVSDRLYSEGTVYISSFNAVVDAKSSPTLKPTTSRVHDVGIRAQLTAYTESASMFMFGFELSFPELEYHVINRVGALLRLSSINPEGSTWLRYQYSKKRYLVDLGVHASIATLFIRSAGLEILQPRVNVSYALTDYWKLKGSFGRVIQESVTINNEDDVISLFDAWISVPKELPVEIADHLVAGISGNPYPQISVDVQAYFKYFSSLVTYNRNKIDATDPDYVTGRGQAYGIETMVNWSATFFALYAAYSFGSVSVTNGGLTYPPRYDRRHSLKTLISKEIVNNLEVAFRWDYASGFPFSQSIGYFDRLTFGDPFRNPDPGETGDPYIRLGSKNGARLPPYHRLDAAISYRFSLGALKAFFGLSAINLYNSRNLFYFDRKTGRRIDMLPFFPSVNVKMEY